MRERERTGIEGEHDGERMKEKRWKWRRKEVDRRVAVVVVVQ